MTKRDKEALQFKIEDEGFDYAITNYAGDIKDQIFQEELAAYQNSKRSFVEYLRSIGIEVEVD